MLSILTKILHLYVCLSEFLFADLRANLNFNFNRLNAN